MYLKPWESLNSCLFSTKTWLTRGTSVSHKLTPLSLDWLTHRCRSKGRVESILSILDFTNAVFKAWCCLFNSSVEFLPATMNIFCVLIECTCDAVIDVEAANYCGASNRNLGMPRLPWAGVKVTSWHITSVSAERYSQDDTVIPRWQKFSTRFEVVHNNVCDKVYNKTAFTEPLWSDCTLKRLENEAVKRSGFEN